MLWDFYIRIIAILITIFITAIVTTYSIWLQGVLALGFLHYFLSIYYAKGKFREIISNKNRFVPIFTLIAFSILLLFIRFPLEIYFAIHHAFNEGFLSKYSRSIKLSLNKSIFSAKSLVHFFVYLFILRHETFISNIPESFLILCIIISYLYYYFSLENNESRLSVSEKLKITAFDLFIIIPLVASLYFKITFLQIVLYHFILWAIIPVKPLLEKGESQLLRYVGLSIALFGIISIFSVRGLSPYALSRDIVYDQFYLWSYIHITTSLALSSAHPDWVIRLFRPQSL